jgi:hypothetical protein
VRQASFIRSRQAPISMRRGARLAGAEFTLLPRFRAAGGATNRERWIFLGFHSGMMHHRLATALVNCDQSEKNFRRRLATYSPS